MKNKEKSKRLRKALLLSIILGLTGGVHDVAATEQWYPPGYWEEFWARNPIDFSGLSEDSENDFSADPNEGFSVNLTYKGWNDVWHRPTLRLQYNPLADTPLENQDVSQPEVITGLQANFRAYIPLGGLSMGLANESDVRFGSIRPAANGGRANSNLKTPIFDLDKILQERETIKAGLDEGRSPLSLGEGAYNNLKDIQLAAETIAFAYEEKDDLLYGEFYRPDYLPRKDLNTIISAALNDTWKIVLEHRSEITPLEAAQAMETVALFLGGDRERARRIAYEVLEVFPGATPEDRVQVDQGLPPKVKIKMGLAYADNGTNADDLFSPDSGDQAWGEIGYTAAFIFNDKPRVFKKEVEPNDPLYLKEGSGKKSSAGLRKGLGFILGAVGAPVQVEDKVADDQWGLHAVGFKPRSTSGSAWDIADGSEKNVVVAVIDSGLDTAHPDGPQYLWINADEIPDNGIDDDANGYVDDVNGWNFVGESNDIRDDFGHGTFVAGIIAAKRNNGQGIAGINPGARIMTLKVLNERGTSKSLGVYRAIRYAVDNGARVLNLSLGGRGLSPLEQIGINYAYTMGCIVVVAAGNESGNIAEFGPPGARRSFSVASMNMDSTRRNASNKGLNVALAAPGESVYSLTAKFEGKRDQRVIPLLAKGYHRLNGTSFAAPFVAATAALIWTRHPHLDHRKVEDMILATAQDIHDPGWDLPTGQGKLDAFAALNQDPDKVLVPRITEFFVNKVKRRIASVDLYGVVRGDVKNYIVEVGRGTKPKKWQQVYGPAAASVDHNLICRIDGQYFAKGSKWKVRVIATGNSGQSKTHEVLVSRR